MFPLLILAATVAAASTSSPAHESCLIPNAPAAVASMVVPERPNIAGMMNVSGTASVQIVLDPTGTLVDASILKSTGYPFLDAAALQTTRRTAFRPEVQDCRAVSGSYIYEVSFDS